MQPLTPTSPELFQPTDIMVFIVNTVCGVIELVGRKHGLSEWVMLRICRHLRRLGARFAKLAAQVAAGELPDPAPPPRRGASPPPAPDPSPDPDPSRIRPPDTLRRNRGWLMDLVPETDGFRPTMNWMFAQPLVKALIAAAPRQLGPILRPLCWMLAADVPTALRLPRRAHPRTVEHTFLPEPEPKQPEDDARWPQWRQPEPPGEPEDESWNMNPPDRPPKNQD